MTTARENVKAVLRATRLNRPLDWFRYGKQYLTIPSFRRYERRISVEFKDWRSEYSSLLKTRFSNGPLRRALIVGKGTADGARIELCLIKALEMANFEPMVLTAKSFVKYYQLAGVTKCIYWEDICHRPDLRQARIVTDQFTSIENLLQFEHAAARVGKFVASSAFRALRVGRLDLSLPETRSCIAEQLATGISRAEASQKIVRQFKPDLALFMGNRYTGQGELMDVCLKHGVDVLTWFDAHRSNALMLKRYAMENRDHHHASLSDESWKLLTEMEWTEQRNDELKAELDDNYAAGDWYSRGGTQFDKEIKPESEIRKRLKLDPNKKTAIIFPHIVWDATLFWGSDLFSNYEEWFVETVRAACANPSLNWIIKIHPAHVAKSAMERFAGEPAELTAVRRYVGELPPHVSVILPDTDINTFSLFRVMDYCLTVRGTIGIEAASLGIRVLTAGTGRYDHKGFTTDSDSREQYLSRLANLHELTKLTDAERLLAKRFAYGAFVLRPMPLSSLSIEHDRDIEATTRIKLNVRSAEELQNAPDLKAFAAWADNQTQEDFLWAPGRVQTAQSEIAEYAGAVG